MKHKIILWACFTGLLFNGFAMAKTLNICLEATPLALDLHKATDHSTIEILHKKVYESLVRYDVDTKEYFNLLTETISFPSANTIQIKIKKNIQWQTNQIYKRKNTLTSEDIIFSIQRQMKSNAYKLFKLNDLDNIITALEKIDEYTFNIKTTHQINNLYGLLSKPIFAIYSKKYFDYLVKNKKENLFHLYPIGTGPFILSSMKYTNRLNLKRNQAYHSDIPKFDAITYLFSNNIELRTNMAITGKCHITYSPSWSSISKIKQNPTLEMAKVSPNNLLYLAFNTKKIPFENKELRKIIAKSLNIDEYLSSLFYGHAQRADHLFTPNLPLYTNKFVPISKNINSAKKELQTIFPKGIKPIKLLLRKESNLLSIDQDILAQKIVDDLNKIGIKTKIVYSNKENNIDYDLFLTSEKNITSQQDILSTLSCKSVSTGLNMSHWCNNDYDKYLNLFKNTENEEKKQEIINDMSLVFNSELPKLLIAYMPNNKIITKKIINYPIAYEESGDYSKLVFLDDILRQLSGK